MVLVMMNGNMQWANGQSYDAKSNATLLIYAVSGATHRSAVVCRSWTLGKTGHVRGCCVDDIEGGCQSDTVR